MRFDIREVRLSWLLVKQSMILKLLIFKQRVLPWLLAQVSPGVKHKSFSWRENTSYINFRRRVRVVSVSFSYSFCA